MSNVTAEIDHSPKSAPAAVKAKGAPKSKAPAKQAKGKGKQAKSNGKKEKRAAAPRGEYVGKKIKLIAKENPKREGSAAHKRFAIYKNGMPVETFLEKGGRTSAIRWDLKHGFIALQ
jgi:hypothetical protein